MNLLAFHLFDLLPGSVEVVDDEASLLQQIQGLSFANVVSLGSMVELSIGNHDHFV